MEQFIIIAIGALALGLVVREVRKSVQSGACSGCPLKHGCCEHFKQESCTKVLHEDTAQD